MDFARADRTTLERILQDPQFGEALKDRARARLATLTSPEAGTPASKPVRPGKRRGEPNQTETRFLTDILEAMVAAGEVVRVEFEPVTFHIHGVGRYTPDWVGWLPDGGLWCWEVKGAHIREQDRVRWKAHSTERPWIRWTMVQWKDGRWKTLYDRQPEVS